MDRNSITGIILIAVILIVFSILSRPSPEEIEAARHRQDSLEMVRQQQLEQEKIQAAREEILEEFHLEETDPADITAEMERRLGAFASGGVGEDEFYRVENENIRIN